MVNVSNEVYKGKLKDGTRLTQHILPYKLTLVERNC